MPQSGVIHPNDPTMKRVRKHVLESAGYRCFLCGHGPAEGSPADGVDHVVPLAECELRGISPWQPGNMRACHSKAPCAYCLAASTANGHGKPGDRAGYCNSLRGTNPNLDYVRAKIARRTGLTIMGVSPSGRAVKPAEAPGERSWD